MIAHSRLGNFGDYFRQADLANNRIQEALSRKFRKLLSGDPNGVPPWLPIVAAGDEPGLFVPTDAPWVVHADFGTLVGGVRALLLQALHPGSLAGVKQHSRYEQDALGRLSGTIRWLTVTTFGSHTAVAGEASRVNRMHVPVAGDYAAADGSKRAYRASDPDLLRWVHIAFMDSFLRTHQLYSAREIPGGADAYVKLWARSVVPLGLREDQVPGSEEELLSALAEYRPQLAVTAETKQVLRFIKRPPLPRTARVIYALLYRAALASLSPEHRSLIGERSRPLWLVRPLTRGTLRFMRWAIGPDSPIEDAARARLRRAGVI